MITMSRNELTRPRVLIDVADWRQSVGYPATLNTNPLPHRPGTGRA